MLSDLSKIFFVLHSFMGGRSLRPNCFEIGCQVRRGTWSNYLKGRLVEKVGLSGEGPVTPLRPMVVDHIYNIEIQSGRPL